MLLALKTPKHQWLDKYLLKQNVNETLDISLISLGNIGANNSNWVEANESFNTLILIDTF